MGGKLRQRRGSDLLKITQQVSAGAGNRNQVSWRSFGSRRGVGVGLVGEGGMIRKARGGVSNRGGSSTF